MKELKCEPCLQEHLIVLTQRKIFLYISILEEQEHLIVLTQRKIFLYISILEEQTDFHWKNNFRDTDHKRV